MKQGGHSLGSNEGERDKHVSWAGQAQRNPGKNRMKKKKAWIPRFVKKQKGAIS